MNPKALSTMIAALLILGGVIFGALGGIHAMYTLLDLRDPRWLVPADPAVVKAMANSAVRLSGGGTNMWRAWIGFNFTHSLGLLLFGALAVWAGFRVGRLSAVVMPALVLVGGVYLVVAWLYFFRSPVIGVAFGTGCFAAAWLLSFR